MKRLLVLSAAALVLGLNACEQHKASELPKEFQEGGEQKKEAAGEKAAHPAPGTGAAH